MNKNIINNKRGQGATEYILLLVVVVGLVMIFGPKIKSIISSKTESLASDVDKVTAQ
jgi:uncharacterized protein (UPF0333 family)